MSFEFYIGGRYLRAKQKQAFVSLISLLSIAGVMVGVMALIVVIAVMTGFDADLKARILGGQSQIMLMRHGGEFKDYRAVITAPTAPDLERSIPWVTIKGVAASTPFVFSTMVITAR